MSNLNRILVGIRDSKLSRTQTNILLNQLVSVSSEITNESFVIKTIKTKGSHSGFSVRVMKGVSYRFGDFEAASEKRIIPLDVGNFILTTKRLIFSGTKKSLDVALSKIVSAKPVENGILIDRTAKQNVEYFIGLDNVKMDMTLVPEIQNGDKWKEQKVKFNLNGFDVRKIIQGVIQKE